MLHPEPCGPLASSGLVPGQGLRDSLPRRARFCRAEGCHLPLMVHRDLCPDPSPSQAALTLEDSSQSNSTVPTARGGGAANKSPGQGVGGRALVPLPSWWWQPHARAETSRSRVLGSWSGQRGLPPQKGAGVGGPGAASGKTLTWLLPPFERKQVCFFNCVCAFILLFISG